MPFEALVDVGRAADVMVLRSAFAANDVNESGTLTMPAT